MIRTVAALLRPLSFALVGFLLFGHASAWAATFTVNSTLDAVDAARGDGVCETAPGNGVCTLRAAIQESNALAGADTIIIPAGTYAITIRPTVSTDATGSFDIKDNLTIVGAGTDATFVDGGNLDTVFAIVGSQKTITISNLTVQNGVVSAFRLGGGVMALGSNTTLTLNDVVIQNNRAGNGAGIYNQGNLVLNRSVVRGNTTTVSTSSTDLHQGGGIYHTTGSLAIRQSTIQDNTAEAAGGVFNMGTMSIDSSTISGNTAANSTLNNGNGGGAIVNGSVDTAGTLTITNSTISGNRANGHHGGIFNQNGTLLLNSDTITANVADADGDGFGNSGGLGLGNTASATMRNSILAANSAAGSAKDCLSLNAAAFTSGGYNLIGNVGNDTDCVFSAGTGDQVGSAGSTVDPGLRALADNTGPTLTHALADTSPAVDAGDPSGCSDGSTPLAADQRGVPRTMAGGSGAARCDIGAYEMARPVVDAGTDQRVNAGVLVTLDGSRSTAWAGIASYAWTQTAGVPVALAAADSATPSFTAPSVPGVLRFQLTVVDRQGISATGTVAVTVNAPPTADAGPDQTVNADSPVSLNGTASRDSDGSIVSFAWVQTGGTNVTLTNADTETPSFVAPAVAGVLTFQLTVTDNDGVTAADSVAITVNVPAPPASEPPPSSSGNKPPVANAGGDETVRPHAFVMLNGWRSYDPDGRILSYRWVQASGTPVSLYGASSPWPFFSAPKTEGTLTFRLTVTDNKGASASDSVTITVDDCVHRWWDFSFWSHRGCHR